MRGTLGTIGFIARLAPLPPYCALFSALCSPSTTPFLSRRDPLPPYLGSGAVAFYYAYGYAYVRASRAPWSVRAACLPPLPT